MLKRRVQAAGLLDKRPGYYAVLLSANSLAFIACLALLGLTRSWWLTALIACALAIVSGQLGFQLHDSAHNQMFGSRRVNGAIAFVTANVLLGMSAGWWTSKHNEHHGNPNHVDLDPDIDVGVIAYSTEQAEDKSGLFRVIAKYQAYLFFPLLLGLGWVLHVNGLKYLFQRRPRHRGLELAVLALHAVAYLVLLVALVGPARALLVLVLQKTIGGFYLASVFAPNHKGMPQIGRDDALDFLRAQVLTARNVRSHPMTDLLYGSLNYQIEHHLFPTMPRCNLRRAQRLIQDFCAEVAVPYYETSIVQSYREILGFLHEVGAPLRQAA